MECNIYTPDLVRIGAVYTCISLTWEEQYNTEAMFELELQMADGLLDLFRPDRYLSLRGSDTLMIIKSVQVTEVDTLLVSGYGITHILTERVSTYTAKNSNAEYLMRRLVSDYVTDWPCLELGASAGITTRFDRQTSDGTVFEYLEKIATECDIGFRIRKDGSKLLFECYKPGINTEARFATKWGNVLDLTYSNSSVDYKNVAVVAGAGQGANRITVVVGDTAATGVDRREVYIDARDVQPEEDETEEAYRERLASYGWEQLAEQPIIENVDFVVQGNVSLGDVVSVKVPEFGVDIMARVISLTTTMEGNVLTKTMSIGTSVTSSSASPTGSASVNGIATGAGGDMMKSVYDTNGNGVVDKAEMLATAHTLTVGNTGKAFDGTADQSWSLAEIGAMPECITSGTMTSGRTLTIELPTGYYVLFTTHTGTANNVGMWLVYKSASGGVAFHLSRETTPHSFSFSADSVTCSTTVSGTITVRYFKIA